MTWFKVDDGFHGHKKVARAGIPAMGLWIVAATWCADNLTDGFLPDYIAARLDPDYEEHADRLVMVKLWEAAEQDGDKGWLFHDWDVYQPSAEEEKAKRDSKSLGGKQGNHRRWHLARGQVDPECPYCSSDNRSVGDRTTESGANRPSRPDPSRPEKKNPSGGAQKPRRESVHRSDKRSKPEPLTGDGGVEIFPEPPARERPVTQVIVGEWIERCKTRPPDRVIGQVTKEIKLLVDEGYDSDLIRRGVADWMTRGQHPSTIPSFVNAAANGGGGTVNRAQQRTNNNLAVVEEMRRRVASEQAAQQRGLTDGRG